MLNAHASTHDEGHPLDPHLDHAARAIPPLWPLASSVAVNPFLGQTHDSLAKAAARLARITGATITMSRAWYLEKINEGTISDDDLLKALNASRAVNRPRDLAALKSAAALPSAHPRHLPTLADLAAHHSKIDWPSLISERFGAWASAYFDEGQALWAAPRGQSAYALWQATATHDLTPEIAGLANFAAHVAEAPSSAKDVIARIVNRLGLSEAALETYFHQLLMSLGGWAQYARYKLWQAELKGETDPIVIDFLAIRLMWEEALYLRYEKDIANLWHEIRTGHSEPVEASPDLIIDEILQTAFERAHQRMLAETLSASSSPVPSDRPEMQMAFCIDVRSEVFRRALESVNPAIETLGFAGFFGLTAAHRRFASDTEELRLPVLLNPAIKTCSGGPDVEEKDRTARIQSRAKRAWGRFKLAAISSFAFVEATGPLYVGKLLSDSLRLGGSSKTAPDPAPRILPELDVSSRIKAAETILRAMSLTANFAPLVILAGHGAQVVNNPHASALHCGACGGYSGEVNARLLASLLNEDAVRSGLAAKGLIIPADTRFVAALHDTTTDHVTLYADDLSFPLDRNLISKAKAWLAIASQRAKSERALRLPRADNDNALIKRSQDWAETRPEWALAGCKAFIAAPRSRTRGKDLAGQAFLHDYDWHKDDGFNVLELILTAPVVVASWISLQYYGSTVAPAIFGGGNKLLHNVTGGIGVIEGNGGVLRGGLPWQSVHDGERLIHQPLRLSVCIEAPVSAITDILERHSSVRALFDNGWLSLFALDDRGQIASRYSGALQWEPVEASLH